jgi:uncharacterized protein
MRMCLLSIAVIAFGLQPQANAASFDCSKATAPVEKLVCSDQELSADDEVIASLYKAGIAKTHSTPTLVQSQRQWIARRNACAANPTTMRSCVMDLYLERATS